MKRFGIILIFAVVLLLGTTVLAENVIVKKEVSEDTEKFVKDVAEKKGVAQEQIQEIKQVDFKDLPEQINIDTIDETNLALYEVGVENDEPVYIITASDEKITTELEKFTRRMFLIFGIRGEISTSGFLESATGVVGSLKKGYVMMRDGSITGVSTNLEVSKASKGQMAEILIYKNGKLTGFRNTFHLSESKVETDYDTVSEDILVFNKGDVISAEIILSDGVVVKDINTLLEITTN